MLMEVKPPLLDTGGLSCRFCRFWMQYTPEQIEELKFADNKWGKCTNKSVNIMAQIGMAHTHSGMVSVQKSESGTVVSTYNNYSCPNYKKILPSSENKK